MIKSKLDGDKINQKEMFMDYPIEVSGLVLVDSTLEKNQDRFLLTLSKDFQDAYQNQFTTESTYSEFMESLKQVKQD
ncbi:hypothetical protein [Alkalicoccobacillus porphyridii]|uniref:Uncharacterized protein n=1 Tax=Alkalicoccobacillus porphyridii TaxID=2597270 RepID=A0A553ZVS9_9BACI|nr:hypothetical protein [Alkalicoccobacillus porphyridii]TSB45567.1 hypothetical protein FN960_15470 [Alkalicoccobacillus porphyridii]